MTINHCQPKFSVTIKYFHKWHLLVASDINPIAIWSSFSKNYSVKFKMGDESKTFGCLSRISKNKIKSIRSVNWKWIKSNVFWKIPHIFLRFSIQRFSPFSSVTCKFLTSELVLKTWYHSWRAYDYES